MQSNARTVDEYVAQLPADRRAAIQTVRKAILACLPAGYEEGMQYGMIGYYVPHSIYPPGYHCDPSQPLPFAGLASQKGHMSLYLSCIYYSLDERERFERAWAASGARKLDAGKACIRFKKVEDLALDVIADAVQRVSVAAYVAQYEAARVEAGTPAKKSATGPAARTTPAKPAAKKVSKKKVSKVVKEKVAKKKKSTKSPATKATGGKKAEKKQISPTSRARSRAPEPATTTKPRRSTRTRSR
ncbi:MAG: DUF1801 domain-containing protein [Phycisphaeraceae bacterium]|nr:DUF1801 domain-containing protein [Phycisphaeraceae bacterium]MCW5763814.1 DUF1801 domain-containing protein [Phycisphaeraceae bacterium]